LASPVGGELVLVSSPNKLDIFSRCKCTVNVTTSPAVILCSFSSSKTKEEYQNSFFFCSC
jgi:hypothetical protein